MLPLSVSKCALQPVSVFAVIFALAGVVLVFGLIGMFLLWIDRQFTLRRERFLASRERYHDCP